MTEWAGRRSVGVDERHAHLQPSHTAEAPESVDCRRKGLFTRAVGYLGLAALVLAGGWLALAAASSDLIVDTAGADEPGWVAGPLAGLIAGLGETGFSLVLLAMLAGYLGLVRCAEVLAPRVVLTGLSLVVAALALAPPLLSSDVFGYIGYGRLGVVHHLNPYRFGPIFAPRDPILPLIYWQHPRSPYGPVFTLGTYTIAERSLPVELWTLKAAAGLAWVASTALVWRCAGLLGRPRLRSAVLMGANPLLLVYGVGGAHNELLVMACVLGALGLLAGGRPKLSGATLAFAVAVKATGGILLPFVLIGSRHRARVALGALSAAVPLAAMTLAVFGSHVLDTLGQIATGNLFNIDYSGPDLLGRLAGTGITGAVRAVCLALVLVAFALSVRAIRGGVDWLTAGGGVTLVVLCAIASLVPWYIAWTLPMAALTPSRSVRVATLAFTAAVVLTHIPLLGFPASE